MKTIATMYCQTPANFTCTYSILTETTAFSHFTDEGNRSRKFKRLAKVTQLIRIKAGIQTQDNVCQSLIFIHRSLLMPRIGIQRSGLW